MKKICYLIFILCLIVFSIDAQTDIDIKEEVPQEAEVRIEEKYEIDGNYYSYTNGVLMVKGHHINKIKNGEFVFYKKSGATESIKNYKLGKLDGTSFEFSNYDNTTEISEYFEGKRVGYVCKLSSRNDTIEKYGPFPKQSVENLIITKCTNNNYKRKKANWMPDETIDSIFFKPNTSITIKKCDIFKNDKSNLNHQYLIDFYKIKRSNYTCKIIDSIVVLNESYSLLEGLKYVSKGKFKIYAFDYKNELIAKADSGYITHYDNGRRLDSTVSSSNEQLITQYVFDLLGNNYLISVLETNKNKLSLTYYDKSMNALYQIESINNVPTKLFVYNDSIKKIGKNKVLIDYYGTAYYYDLTGKIDSSKSKATLALMNRNKIKSGKYIFMPHKVQENSMKFNVIEFKNNGLENYRCDSTFTYDGSIDQNITDYGKDSIIYYVKENKNTSQQETEEKYPYFKFICKNDKLFYCENRFRFLNCYNKESFLCQLSNDTLPVIKSELIPIANFKKIIAYKSITTITKTDLSYLLRYKEALEKRFFLLQELFPIKSGSLEVTIHHNALIRLLFEKIYTLGYNPFFRADEFRIGVEKLALNESENRQAMYLIK